MAPSRVHKKGGHRVPCSTIITCWPTRTFQVFGIPRTIHPKVESHSSLALALAIVGAVTGVTGLFVAIAAFWRDKVTLSLNAWFRRESPNGPLRLVVEAVNRGRQPATLTYCQVAVYEVEKSLRERILFERPSILRMYTRATRRGRMFRRVDLRGLNDWQRLLDVSRGSNPIPLAPGEIWSTEVTDIERRLDTLANERSFAEHAEVILVAVVVDSREDVDVALLRHRRDFTPGST